MQCSPRRHVVVRELGKVRRNRPHARTRRNGSSASPWRIDGRGNDSELVGLAQKYLERRGQHLEADPALAVAWERFYEVYAPVIRSFVHLCRLRGADAKDCEQDVWHELVVRLPHFRYDPQRGRFRSWLYVLTRYTSSDLVRRRRRVEPLSVECADGLRGRDMDPVVIYEREWTRQEVRERLAELRARVSETSFQVVYLRWIEGWTLGEIAAYLGLTSDQARSRHHRMMRKLWMLFWVGGRPAFQPRESALASTHL